MKSRKWLWLIVVISIVSLMKGAFGQSSLYVLHDASNVTSYALTNSDTAYSSGHSIRASFTPGIAGGIVPSVVWKRPISEITAPSGLRFWAYVPNYAEPPNIVFSLKGPNGQSTTLFTSLDHDGWKQYGLSFNLTGFNVDTLFIGVSSSDLSGAKVAFIDDIQGGYASGSWVTLEDAEAPLPLSPTPTLLSPANGAVNTGSDVQFTCANISNALYLFQIARDNNFSSLVLDYQTDTNLITYQGFSASTQYYWRAKAKIPGHQYSDWSSVWSFNTGTTIPVPAVPTLLSPTNGASNVPNPVFFDWGDVANAIYRIQIMRSDGTIFADNTITTSSGYTANLLFDTYYLWRVNASNSVGTSEWSPLQGFTTSPSAPQPPMAPTLSAPADKTANIPVNAPLYWGAVTGAISYYLEVGTSPTFETIVYGLNAASTYAITTPLQYYSVYWWRVRASNGLAMSEWSTIRSFTTIDWHQTDISDVKKNPTEFALSQNYPNPFNPITTISYQLPKASYVRLTLFSSTGQEIRTLVDGNMPAGSHNIQWDALDDTGNNVASGVYFYRIETSEFTNIKKMTFVK